MRVDSPHITPESHLQCLPIQLVSNWENSRTLFIGIIIYNGFCRSSRYSPGRPWYEPRYISPACHPIIFLIHCPGGLGSSIGKKLRQQGASLAILYAPFEASRRDELLERGYGADSAIDEIHTYECDITSSDSVQSAFHLLDKRNTERTTSNKQETDFPSILINTAGYVSLSDMEITPPEETLKHLTTNIYGPMLCSQAFANMYFSACQAAEKSSDPAPPGRIVSLSSQAAHAALHRHGAYCASKAGLLGLTRSMASEWGGRGITSNTVSPTVAWTELGKKAWGEEKVRNTFLENIPTGKFALPEEVADSVLFLCQVCFKGMM